jgi:GAF domain-containing protein
MNNATSYVPPNQVDITSVLVHRPCRTPDYQLQKQAVSELLQIANERPSELLVRFVAIARELCGAESAGISLYEPDGKSAGVFRWHHLSGTLAPFTGATTPRDFSPCGICLDRRQPILMAHPEQAYDWIKEAHITVPEVLLVPLQIGIEEPIGTLWVVAVEGQKFDSEHSRILNELAGVTSIATQLARLSKMPESERVRGAP